MVFFLDILLFLGISFVSSFIIAELISIASSVDVDEEDDDFLEFFRDVFEKAAFYGEEHATQSIVCACESESRARFDEEALKVDEDENDEDGFRCERTENDDCESSIRCHANGVDDHEIVSGEVEIVGFEGGSGEACFCEEGMEKSDCNSRELEKGCFLEEKPKEGELCSRELKEESVCEEKTKERELMQENVSDPKEAEFCSKELKEQSFCEGKPLEGEFFSGELKEHGVRVEKTKECESCSGELKEESVCEENPKEGEFCLEELKEKSVCEDNPKEAEFYSKEFKEQSVCEERPIVGEFCSGELKEEIVYEEKSKEGEFSSGELKEYHVNVVNKSSEIVKFHDIKVGSRNLVEEGLNSTEIPKIEMGSVDALVSVTKSKELVTLRDCLTDNEGVFDEEEGLFDDWERIERTELERRFGAAVAFMGSKSNAQRISSLDSDLKRLLNGLHKVAIEGPCCEPQPMALKFSARSKWNAWHRIGDMSPEAAMEQYISLLSQSIPGWMGDDTLVLLVSDLDFHQRSIRSSPSLQLRAPRTLQTCKTNSGNRMISASEPPMIKSVGVWG